MQSTALWRENQSRFLLIDPLLSRRQPKVVLQVREEPCDHGQRDARTRAKHELTFHSHSWNKSFLSDHAHRAASRNRFPDAACSDAPYK